MMGVGEIVCGFYNDHCLFVGMHKKWMYLILTTGSLSMWILRRSLRMSQQCMMRPTCQYHATAANWLASAL